jgi:hypothetical protein
MTQPGLDDLPAPLRATDEEREVPLQRAILIRHGETEWTLTGQHTGVTDIPLTENGRSHARRLAPLLSNATFSLVLTSPLQRARETCELVGLGNRATIDVDLMEWRYGEYEGLTTKEIRARRPGWSWWREPRPGCRASGSRDGADQVSAGRRRPDRARSRVQSVRGPLAGASSSSRQPFLARHRHGQRSQLLPRCAGVATMERATRLVRGSAPGRHRREAASTEQDVRVRS